MVFLIIISNIFAFMFYLKKKNIYFSSLIILLCAFIFGTISGILAVVIINDAFAIFYGMQVGGILLWNSIFVFILAILVSIIKKLKKFF